MNSLEHLKTEAEIEEIQARTRDITRRYRLEWGKAALGVVTIIASVVTAAIGLFEYLHEREKEQSFRITVELLKIIDDLNSGEQSKERDAALNLGFFGVEASEFLISHLQVEGHSRQVREAIYQSLLRICSKDESAAKSVLGKLERATSIAIDQKIRGVAPQQTVSNHLGAFEFLATHAPRDSAVRNVTRQALVAVQDYANQIAVPSDDAPETRAKKTALENIEEALTRTKAGN